MKKLFTVFAACICALSLTACGSSSDNGNTLVVGAETLTGTFSPLYYTSAYDNYVVEMVYTPLMSYDVNNTLQPALAESYDASPDGKSITFHLKKGVKFSDGSAFTAQDVAFTYKAVADPSYTGRYGQVAQHLVGYSDYSLQGLMGSLTDAKAKLKAAEKDVKAAKKKKDADKEKAATEAKDTANAEVNKLQKQYDDATKKEPAFPGIDVIDDYTIKFNFDAPRNDNLTTLMGMGGILDYNQFKKTYKYGFTKPLEDAMKKPVGTGPYVLDKWTAGAGASFSKNKNYSAKQLGDGYKISKVIIKPVPMETEYDQLKSGSIDYLASQIEPKKIGPASNNKKLTIQSYVRGGAGYLAFNTENGATGDQTVRQALTYAFNRQSFVNSFYECKDCNKDLGNVQIGYVPTTYNNPLSKLGDVVTGKEKLEGLNTYNYDMDKAKALLDADGWKVGSDGKRSKDGKPLEIKLLAIKDHDILNNLIPMWKQSWEAELGVTFKVATVDFNTLLDKVYSDEGLSDWNVIFLATSYTSDSMSDIYTQFDSQYAKANNDNISRLKDPTLDALMDSAQKEMDPAKALDAWKQVAIRVNDDCTEIPIYGNTYFDFYNKKLKNMKVSALSDWTKGLKNATIDTGK